jgi:hypothetical protein
MSALPDYLHLAMRMCSAATAAAVSSGGGSGTQSVGPELPTFPVLESTLASLVQVCGHLAARSWDDYGCRQFRLHYKWVCDLSIRLICDEYVAARQVLCVPGICVLQESTQGSGGGGGARSATSATTAGSGADGSTRPPPPHSAALQSVLLAASKADVAGARAALLALQESNQVCRVMQ